MESSPPSREQELYDPIRKRWVVATPEEIVRQKLVMHLTKTCQFPIEVMTVEKKLSELPHLLEKKQSLPERRLDLLCFGPKLAFPLLLIECKAVPLNEKMLTQVWGYNAYVEAPFVALVNENQIKMRWEENGQSRYRDFMPTYEELVAEHCRWKKH